MPCCQPNITSFVNQDTVTIAYSAQMLQDYGSRPTVDVIIQDTNGEFYYALPFGVRKALIGFPNTTQIKVYLGGPATGVIRIQ